MPDFSLRNLCWTIIWLSIFTIAVIIAVLPLHAFLPASCEITSEPFKDTDEEKQCVLKVNVNVTVNANETKKEFFTQALVEKDTSSKSTEYLECNDNDDNEDIEFPKKYGKGEIAECWYSYNDEKDVRFFNESTRDDLEYAVRFSDILSKAALAMSGLFGLCFVICLARMFNTELMRCCPRVVLRMWVNVSTFFFRRGSPRHRFMSRRRQNQSPNPSANETIAEQSVSLPPMTSSRRRISTLVENAKLSDEEVQALHSEGWSCCICLDVEPDNGYFPPVSRLHCNHATHSECLRSWLEKGRAVCCLCNADVFPDETKEATASSGGSTASGYDIGPLGSLEVERTEGAPSSPATSILVDQSQQSLFSNPHPNERDGEV